MHWFFLLFFFMNALFAEPPKENENDLFAVNWYGEPSAYVAGCVNVITGDFVISETDDVLHGTQGISLSRTYSSSQCNERDLGLGWSLNHGSSLMIWTTSAKLFEGNCETQFKKEGNHYGISSLMLQKGFTNTGTGQMGGRTHPANLRLEKAEYCWKLKDGSGVIKRYVEAPFDGVVGADYKNVRITEERRSTGLGITYLYRSQDLVGIQAVNGVNRSMSCFNFDRPDKRTLESTSTAGSHVRYDFKHNYLLKVTCTENPVENYEYNFVDHYPAFQEAKVLTKRNRPDHRYLKISYYGMGIHEMPAETVRIKEESDPLRGLVKCLRQPSGTDTSPITIYSFEYSNRQQSKKGGTTLVTDALGNKTKYFFGKSQRLNRVEKYENDGSIYAAENFKWKGPNLKSRNVEDATGTIVCAKDYEYDDRGNVLTEIEYGNFSGEDLYGRNSEKFVKRFTYSQDGLNLKLTEEAGRQKIYYLYNIQNDSLRGKLYVGDGKIFKREFYEYNGDFALVKSVEDDGTTSDPQDLTSVTERHITEISPSTEYPVGAPVVIDEKYLDLSTGHETLKKRVINTYSPEGLLIRQKHCDNQGVELYTLTWEYDDKRNLIREVDAIGRVIERKYDANKNVIFEKGPNPEIWKRFTYDFMDRLIQEEQCHITGEKLITTHRYDFMSNKTATVDPYGQETTYTYDEFGRLIKQNYPATVEHWGNLYQANEKWKYDCLGNITNEIDGQGLDTTHSYTTRGQVSQTIYPDGKSLLYRYDLDGSLIKTVAFNGTYDLYTNDYAQRPIRKETYSAEGELLTVTTAEYNTYHLLKETDPMGNVTNYEYRPDGKLAKKTKGDVETTFFYDSQGRLVKTCQRYGDQPEDVVVAAQKFDLLNRVVEDRTEDFSGNVLTRVGYEYDIQGRITKTTTYPLQGPSVTTTVYNTHGDPILSIDPEGNRTITRRIFNYYNPWGQHCPCIETTDPLGNITVQSWDTRGRPAFMIKKDPFGNIVQTIERRYDGSGNLLSLVDNGITTLTKYNALNQPYEVIERWACPDQKRTIYSYDSGGRRSQIIRSDGSSLYFMYDPLGRLQYQWSSDGTIDYEYRYDANSNLIQVEDNVSGIRTQRSYDTNDRLIREDLGNGLSMEYAYDYLSRPRQVRLPDQSTIEYTYKASQLKAVSHRSNTHTYEQYDHAGHLLRAQLIGEAGKVDFSYDALGRRRTAKHAQWEETLEQFDPLGNLLKKIVHDSQGDLESVFTYDVISQLKSEEGVVSHTYVYDANYNCLEKDGQIHEVGAFNRLLKDKNNSYEYDTRGNLINKSTTGETYTYDALNRLVAYTQGLKQIRYAYDHDHRRLSQINLDYVEGQWQEKSKILFLYQGQNEIGAYEGKRFQSLRILGLGKGSEIGSAVSIELEGKAYAPIFDHTGSVAALIDPEDQTTLESYRYSAFGEPEKLPRSPWMFSSKRYDIETKLYYYGMRYFDPKTARWITQDPLGREGGMNAYAYVLNNPLTYIDLYGLFGEPDVIRPDPNRRPGDYSRGRGNVRARVERNQGNPLRLVGKAIELIGLHAVPIPLVQDGVQAVGWVMQGNSIADYRAHWRQEYHSRYVYHEGKGNKSSKETLSFTNGILTSFEDFLGMVEDHSNAMGGYAVHGTFTSNHGLMRSLGESVLELLRIPTHAQKVQQYGINQAAESVGGKGEDGTIYATVHSRGGLTLCTVDSASKKMIRANFIGSPISPTHLQGFKNVTCYVAPCDFVALADPVGLVIGLCSENVKIVEGKGCPLFHHLWNGESYREVQKEIRRKYESENFNDK